MSEQNKPTFEEYKESFEKIAFDSESNVLKYLQTIDNINELSKEDKINYPLNFNNGAYVSELGGSILYFYEDEKVEYFLAIESSFWYEDNLDTQLKRLYEYFYLDN